MSEAFSAERLAQLEERWRREPASRVFLQVAEEHRRGGDLRRAVEVLEQGLERHPGYVSALVLLGRCRLEAGDPPRAIEALEPAVVHDPAQLVANKLLVEAYLATGRISQARERIEFYRLFNDRDPEIDELERRIDAAVRAAPPMPPAVEPAEIFDLSPASRPPLDLASAAVRPAGGAAEPFGAVHDRLTASRRFEAAIAAEGIFPLAPPATVADLPKPTFGDVFDLEPVPTVAATNAVPAWKVEVPAVEGLSAPSVEAPAAGAPPPPVEPVELAPPLASTAEAPAPISAAPPERTTPPWGFRAGGRELELDAHEQVVAEPFSPRSIGEEVERETIEEPFDEVLTGGGAATAMPATDFASIPEHSEPSDAVPEPPVEVGPSSTLGELYLAQGYLDEAGTEFRRVLDLRPDDAIARAGLEEIDRRRAPVEETASGWREGAAPSAPVGGLTQRKVATLRRYLDRLRPGRERQNVS